MTKLPLNVRMLFAGIAAVFVAAPFTGCHSDAGQPLTDTQKQGADRLATISKTSGGDWDKVSQADKDYIIKNIANGDEHTARMLVAPPPGAVSGPVGSAPGGARPPVGGPGAPAGKALGQ